MITKSWTVKALALMFACSATGLLSCISGLVMCAYDSFLWSEFAMFIGGGFAAVLFGFASVNGIAERQQYEATVRAQLERLQRSDEPPRVDADADERFVRRIVNKIAAERAIRLGANYRGDI